MQAGSRRHVVGAVAWAALVAGAVVGCQPVQRSTRLTIGDLNHTVTEVRTKLADAEFLATRNADSPPMRVMINKVRNLTNDVIAPSEQWLLMARVRQALMESPMARQKNITFLINPERWNAIRRAGYDGDLGKRTQPTHAMTADFRSAARTAADAQAAGFAGRRQDYYYVEYALTDLTTGDMIWNPKVEFKREAKGLVID